MGVEDMSEARLVELEFKLAYQEDAIAALNDVIYQQQQRIDSLETRLGQYRRDMDSLMTQTPSADPGQEKPPHY